MLNRRLPSALRVHRDSGRGLDLKTNNLNGTLPESMSALTALQYVPVDFRVPDPQGQCSRLSVGVEPSSHVLARLVSESLYSTQANHTQCLLCFAFQVKPHPMARPHSPDTRFMFLLENSLQSPIPGSWSHMSALT